MSLDCAAVESLFSPRLDDDLDVAARAAFDLHVRDCPRCAGGFFRLRASLAALRGLPAPDVRGVAQRALEAATAMRAGTSLEVAVATAESAAASPLAAPSPSIAELPIAAAPSPSTSPIAAAPATAAPRSGRAWRAWRRLRAPLVGVAAAAALVGASAAAGAWGGRAAASPERVLAAHGLVHGDDGWITAAERAHRARGEVWIDGAWRDRDAARHALVGELEPRHGAWLDAAARDALDRGLVLGADGWAARDSVAESTLRAAGLARDGESWLAEADRAGMRVDGRAVDPEDWLASRLASAGYVRGEDGRWRPGEDLRREQGGEVRVAGDWLRPETALARWLADRGYVQVDGRWRDATVAAAAAAAAPAAAAIAAPPPPDPWIELSRLPGARDGAVTADAARAALHQVHAVQTVAAPQKPHPVPFAPAPGMTGWRVPLTGENSHPALGTPAIVDGRVHVGEGLNGFAVDAFAADTGKPLWSTRLADNGPSNPVPYGDGVVYATESCSVYALAGRTGHANLARWLGGSLHAMPAVALDQVLCTTAIPGGFALLGQSTKSPRAWAAPLGTDVRTAPIVVDDRVVAATRSGALLCWRAADGGELWRAEVGALSPPAIAAGGHVIVRRALRARDATCYGEALAAIDVSDGSTVPGRLGAARAIAGRRPYEANAAAADAALPDLGPAACADGFAVVVRGDTLEAIDLATGRSAWTVALDGDENGATASDPCIARGKVIVGTLAGEVVAFDLADGSRCWTARIGAPIGNVAGADGAMLRVQPVVANGRVYVTTRTGELVCIDTGDATLDGPHAWGQR